MKTFAARYAFIKSADNEFIGGYESNRHQQGTIFVQAKFKKDALAKMVSLGYKVPPVDCTIGSGDDLDALLAAGLINAESLILMPANKPDYVARVWTDGSGERKVARLGELVRDAKSPVNAMVFVPVAEAQ